MLFHDPVNPLGVDRLLRESFSLAPQEPPGPTIAVAGQVTDERLQVCNQLRIIRPPMSASVAPIRRAFASGG